MVHRSVSVFEHLLPDSNCLSAEIENKHSQNGTAFDKKNVMPVETNNKTMSLYFVCFFLSFPSSSQLMYFTKITVCDGLENLGEKKQTDLFLQDSLKSTGIAGSGLPGSLLKCKISGATPDPLNQN